MGTRLELKSGETNTYEVSIDDSFYGVMTYINGQEVSGDVFNTASTVWDKYVNVTPPAEEEPV